jgi:hypothetical protein
MPKKTTTGQADEQSATPNAHETAASDAAAAEALDEVIRDYAEAKKLEWRPRRNAAVARRIGRFEEAIRRNSEKPPS